MQSRENLQSPKRAVPALNLDTNMQRDNRRPFAADSPPRTPNKPGKGNAAVANRAINPPPRETFLDDITPVNDERDMHRDIHRDVHRDVHRDNRDSHDLSLSPRQITRDSLVDNMLLSLDQLHMGSQNEYLEDARIYSSFADDDAGFNSIRSHRGYGHEYSYSSDLENTPDDGSRYSSQNSRGRRSNSSSNFSTLRGMGSKRSHEYGRMPQSRMVHSRSGRGSKGSSANSVDLGHTQTSAAQRWAHGGRSSSFDLGQDRSLAYANNLASQVSIASFSPYDYDAAPTPTVPGGPRRQQLAPYPEPSPTVPPPPPPSAMAPLERKRSAKSSKSIYKGRSDTLTSRHNGTQDMTRDLPDLPALPNFAELSTAAPAPTVGYGKTKDLPPPTSVPKERPGFFRRVFGHSKNTTPAVEQNPASNSSTSVETSDRPNSKQLGHQNKGSTSSPASKQQPHSLTKKPSSFFRRRKKSVSEHDIPPPLPSKVDVDSSIGLPPLPRDLSSISSPLPRQTYNPLSSRRGSSPVSSLRQVMNPYLDSPLGTPQRTAHIDETEKERIENFQRKTRGFSPGYEPNESATIRQVRSASSDLKQTMALSPAVRESVTANGPIRRASDNTNNDAGVGSGSFLHDNSDNDHDESTDTETKAIEKKLPSPPLSSPASRQSLRPASKGVQQTPAAISSLVKDEEDNGRLQAPKSKAWPESTSSDDHVAKSKAPVPPIDVKLAQQASQSTSTVYKSATSLPVVQVEGEEESGKNSYESGEAPNESQLSEPKPKEPTEGDRERAQKIYDGNEDFIQKQKAAAWLGDEGIVRQRTLTAYMELYSFTDLSIIAALRVVCSRLVLKGETQQVDRILDQFSKRWCECNPNHGFKIPDVVHTLCYSFLLLNTDLHLADIDTRMSKTQFVKNTISTVRHIVQDHVPESFDRHSMLPPPRSQSRQDSDPPPSTNINDEATKDGRPSVDVDKPSWRLSMRPPARTDSDIDMGRSANGKNDDCGPLVKAPFKGTLRAWETQVENVLKETYNSIRDERLPLFGAESAPQTGPNPSQSTLSVFTNGILRRTPSVLSKAPSEAQSYTRGRPTESLRFATGKWNGKSRSRPRLYPHSTMGSSRTSLDDQSVWSPGQSSSWSKYSLGKTHTSMSVDSFGSHWAKDNGHQYQQFQQSIGFANALSQAIIREDTGTAIGSNGSDDLRTVPLLEDESLELAGAPWAKEGIVKHKHHLESVDKKAKDRNWVETFAVIEKGYMSLFSFSSKSMRSRNKSRPGRNVVGGGNWQDNAENLGSFLLRQTIASALPSPGYSKSRPHVWALSLPTGAVHLFQVGTPEIVREFVATANYWSARLSNHPLVGGISNIEYGWSDSIVNNSLVSAIYEQSRPSTSGHRPSLQGSIRSSIDQGIGGVRARLPGDKVVISDWTPPQQSMHSSNLLESDQLHTLTSYVKSIEEELQKHNQLRSPMLLAFTPRHPNAVKAMANWEKKSAYLLREIVKFRTYIDCLHAAEEQKQRIYAEREAQQAVAEQDNEEGTEIPEAGTTITAQG